MASGGYGITPAAPPPGDSSGPRFGSEEASGSLRMELQTPNCPQCPAWVVAWCRGRRPGAVLFTRSTGSGRSLRVVPLVIYGLNGVTDRDCWPQLPPGGIRPDWTAYHRRTELKGQRCSLLVDAEGADVMPSRPNEHSSLGVPVGGCSHHLKCDWLTRSVGRRRPGSAAPSTSHPP